MKKIITGILLLYSIVFLSQETIFDIAREGSIPLMEKVIKTDNQLINTKNDAGFTPLILASYANNKDIVMYLLTQKADVNILSPMGTAMMAATYKGNKDIVKLLLNHGANPIISDQKGTTALHYACIFNNKEIVTMIMALKPNLNLKDANKKTALDYAIQNKNIEIIKLLKP